MKTILEILEEFYITHKKLCHILKKDTIDYTLGYEKINGKMTDVLFIAQNPNDTTKHSRPIAIDELIDGKSLSYLFLCEISNVLFADSTSDISVTKQANFKEFIYQFNNSKFNALILENELSDTVNNKKMKI